MGLNDTPASGRVHIGFFGRRNAGKSSLVNAVTGQNLAVVSDTKGTTTDPVYKSMELLPLGPVLIIDTPGIDDEGDLGELRMEKTRQVLNKTDMAILVIDASEAIGCLNAGEMPHDALYKKLTGEEEALKGNNNIGTETSYERVLIEQFEKRGIPYLIVYNKCDLISEAGTSNEVDSGNEKTAAILLDNGDGNESQLESRIIYVSSTTKQGIEELKERMANLIKTKDKNRQIVGDLLRPLDLVVLVIPIDSSAPKGRLILPQQQVIRDVLEAGAVSVVVKDTELEDTLKKLGTKPYMVITDSQAFAQVSKITPEDVYLTSFSILMARWKGFLKTAVKGTEALSTICDGDEILIAEGCTHHRQCEDIGTVKLPNMIRKYTGAEPKFTFTSGGDYPEELGNYKMILQCGGCMLNEKAVRYRMKRAVEQGVPFTNYGTAMAKMNGILDRSVEILKSEWKG